MGEADHTGTLGVGADRCDQYTVYLTVQMPSSSNLQGCSPGWQWGKAAWCRAESGQHKMLHDQAHAQFAWLVHGMEWSQYSYSAVVFVKLANSVSCGLAT